MIIKVKGTKEKMTVQKTGMNSGKEGRGTNRRVVVICKKSKKEQKNRRE